MGDAAVGIKPTITASDFLKQVVWKNKKLPQRLLQFSGVGELDDEHEDELFPNYDDEMSQSSTASSTVSAASSALSFDGVITSTQKADLPPDNSLCKICSKSKKDTVLVPCGHMICSNCWDSWSAEVATFKSAKRTKRGRRRMEAENGDLKIPFPHSNCDAMITLTCKCKE